MKKLFQTLAFVLGIKRYTVETDRFWQLFQIHPNLGMRVLPSRREEFDAIVRGKFVLNEDAWTISFMDEADAALFKLTFS